MSAVEVTLLFILYVLAGTILLRQMGITGSIAGHFKRPKVGLVVYNAALFFWIPVVISVWVWRITKRKLNAIR